MDLIEIIVRTEDAFGIRISDAEATCVTTPHELIDLAAGKVSLSDAPACLSQQAFYFLREHFQSHLSVSRREFRPNMSLEKIVPKQNRRQLWATLQADIGVNALPNLGRPSWLFLMLVASTIFIFFYVTFIIWNNSSIGFGIALLCGSVAAIGFGHVSSVVTRPAKQYFYPKYNRVGDIANYLVANKPHAFKRSGRVWTRAQVREVVREIVSEYLGSQEFSDDAHFIDDLHLD